MIVCSKCGASNGPGKTECRMCASPLTGGDSAATSNSLDSDSLRTTVVFESLRTRQDTASLTECLICPECQTINRIGWLFCPQCGKKVDASFLQTMEPADRAPTIDASMDPNPETVQIPLEDIPPPRRAQTTQPEQVKRDRTASIPPQPAQWRHEPPLAPPAISVQPVQQAPEPRSPLANSSNGAADKEPVSQTPAIEHKIACTECGAENDSKYFFCLNCGTGLAVTKTVVMASIANPTKPRLRLLVQGEVSGPTYEIKNEASIGRTEGSITFPRDGFMSSSHARVVKRGTDYILIDETSSNGTFIKVKKETKLEPGDVILVGGQLLRFEA